jgi:hypothetical protein
MAGLSHAELVKAAESAAKHAILGGADVIDDRLLPDALSALERPSPTDLYATHIRPSRT